VDYAGNLMKTVTGGVSSTAAMGKGVTEVQLTKVKLCHAVWVSVRGTSRVTELALQYCIQDDIGLRGNV
jgi:Isocitrate lyase family